MPPLDISRLFIVHSQRETTERQRLCDNAKVRPPPTVSWKWLQMQVLTTSRPEPSQTRVGSAARRGAVKSDRLEAFLRESPRDGNIGVILPDCTPDVNISRKEKRATMREKIKAFTQEYGK